MKPAMVCSLPEVLNLAVHGFRAFFFAQGLQGFCPFFFAQGLQGFCPLSLAKGLQGFCAFLAQGLQGFCAFLAQGFCGSDAAPTVVAASATEAISNNNLFIVSS